MRHLRPLLGLVRRTLTVPTVIALVALTVALTRPAYGTTGGNFILGKINQADSITTLIGGTTGGETLAVKPLGTDSHDIPLDLVPATGVAPMETASTTKVTHLNVDLLDGLDSVAFQRKVVGSCTAGQSISAINGNGVVTCGQSSELLSAASTSGALALTTVAQFTVSQHDRVEVILNGTAFRTPANGAGTVSVELSICSAAPCGPSSAVETVLAQMFAKTATHIPASTIQTIDLEAGNYVIGLSALSGTTTGSNDHYSWSLIGFPL